VLREEKENLVAELSDQINESRLIILTTFSGLSVESMTALRRALRKTDSTYRVVKNTLLRRAAQDSALNDFDEYFNGSSAVVFAKGEASEPCKVLKDFMKEHEAVTVKGGVLDEKAVTKEQIATIASLPSREVLLAKLLFMMNAPKQGLVNVLGGVPQKFVRVLEEVRKQKEG
jgi:large subunit ribosomal protein L10